MTKYLLDTNIPVYLEDPDSPFHHPVKERCQQLQDEDQVFVSVLSLYELYYAVALRKKEGIFNEKNIVEQMVTNE